uniref:Capsular biosynthesis protein n=1 Tax=Geobacter sp. (strain M21) TaxID=443144 RepID=C6E5V8_GEOSM
MKEDYADYIYVDLDGTLCPLKGEGERYEDLPANEEVIRRLLVARKQGYRIVIHTARNMRTYQGELSRINIETAPGILEWLKKRNVPYDGLLVGKPWPGPRGFYVDDRAVRPDEFVHLDEEGIRSLLRGPEGGGI